MALLLVVGMTSCQTQAQKVKPNDDFPYWCYIGVHSNTSGGSGVDTWKLTGFSVDTTEYLQTLEMVQDSSGTNDKAVRAAARHLQKSLRDQGFYFKEVKVGTLWDSSAVNVLGDTVALFRIRIGIDSLQNFDTIPPVINYMYQLTGGAEGSVSLWNDAAYQDTVGTSRACTGYQNETYVDTFSNEVKLK